LQGPSGVERTTAKSIDETIDELRRSIVRWKEEMVRLRAEGGVVMVARVEKAIADAESFITRWNNPNY
jgi:hypothetical protein